MKDISCISRLFQSNGIYLTLISFIGLIIITSSFGIFKQDPEKLQDRV